jgi:MoxR-like ATPase
VQKLARPVLRHRLVPTYEAEAEGLGGEGLLEQLIGSVRVP